MGKLGLGPRVVAVLLLFLGVAYAAVQLPKANKDAPRELALFVAEKLGLADSARVLGSAPAPSAAASNYEPAGAGFLSAWVGSIHGDDAGQGGEPSMASLGQEAAGGLAALLATVRDLPLTLNADRGQPGEPSAADVVAALIGTIQAEPEAGASASGTISIADLQPSSVDAAAPASTSMATGAVTAVPAPKGARTPQVSVAEQQSAAPAVQAQPQASEAVASEPAEKPAATTPAAAASVAASAPAAAAKASSEAASGAQAVSGEAPAVIDAVASTAAPLAKEAAAASTASPASAQVDAAAPLVSQSSAIAASSDRKSAEAAASLQPGLEAQASSKVADAPEAGAGTSPSTALAKLAATPPSDVVEVAAHAATVQPPSIDAASLLVAGNSVIAGRAAPLAEVTVRANDTVVGTATADAHGQWTLVPAKDLAPGSYMLHVSAKAPDASLATEGPVIAMSIAQSRLANPAPAAAGTAAGGIADSGSAPSSNASGAAVGSEAAAKPAATALEQQLAAKFSQVLDTWQAAQPADTEAGHAAGPAGAEVAPSQDVQIASTAPVPSANAAGSVAAAAASASPSDALALTSLHYMATGDQSGRIALAGRAKPSQIVRLFVDDHQVGQVTASPEGGWQLDSEHWVAPGAHVARADASDAKGEVSTIYRFDRQTGLSGDETLMLAQQSTVPAPSETTIAPAAPAATAPAAAAAPPASLSISDVRYERPTDKSKSLGTLWGGGTMMVVGRGTPGAEATILIDGRASGKAPVGQDGRWSVQMDADLWPGKHIVKVEDSAAPPAQPGQELEFDVASPEAPSGAVTAAPAVAPAPTTATTSTAAPAAPATATTSQPTAVVVEANVPSKPRVLKSRGYKLKVGTSVPRPAAKLSRGMHGKSGKIVTVWHGALGVSKALVPAGAQSWAKPSHPKLRKNRKSHHHRPLPRKRHCWLVDPDDAWHI